jgi:hypothetical protein
VSTHVWLDWDVVAQAAAASDDIYLAADKTDFDYWRKVEQFRLAGELAAAVRFSGAGKRTAYVAIRGTSLLGNWLFTNVQAYFRAFNVVDESLSGAPSTPYQGGTYRTPIPGSLHQGFYRAFSWLWYGTEPILGNTQPDRVVGFARLRRYVALFALVPLLLVFALKSTLIALVVALVLAFAFVTLESGVWEDVFRDHPSVQGDEPFPFQLIAELNKCDQVVFTGHSLGGSIAVIAYCIYRCWCLSSPGRKDNAFLVTFGAPRVGDVKFMEEFCRTNRGRYYHVVHPGDPVPELPPNGIGELWSRKVWSRGLLGGVVLVLYPFWALVALLYRNQRAVRWAGDSLTEIGPGVTDKLKFAHHSMSKIYRPWAKGKADRAMANRRSPCDRDVAQETALAEKIET